MTSDYKRAYKLPDSEGWLFEERRGEVVMGCDQGYVEADWRIEFSWWQEDRKHLPFDYVDYSYNHGWSNEGPRLEQWAQEDDYESDDYMTDDWIRENYECIEDPAAVKAFAMSRPGLYEHLKEELDA